MPRPEVAPGDLEALGLEPDLQPRFVARNRGRDVFALERERQPRFYLKRFFSAAADSQARDEAAIHRRLQQRGLEVAAVVAVAHGALVLRALPGIALDRAISGAASASVRGWAEDFGRLLARWHAAGVEHSQCFAWHVWVHRGELIGLLDLAEVRCGRRPRSPERDFAALFATLSHRSFPAHCRMRSLRAYGLARGERRRLWGRIEARQRVLRRRFRFPRDWQGEEHHHGADRLLVHESLRLDDGLKSRLRGAFDLDSWWQPEGARRVRERDGRINLRWEDAGGKTWFGKCFVRRGRGRRHPAMEEFASHRLVQWLGIPVPTVLVVGRRDRSASVLWTRGVVPGESLRDHLHVHLQHDLSRGEGKLQVREWLMEVARWARRLHSAGLVHGDLYLDHALLGAEGLVCIDFGRLRRLRFLRDRIKDLAALEYSSRSAGVARTDRLRMFRVYSGGSGGISRRSGSRARGLRRLLSAIVRRADRIQAREQRHGRWPVARPLDSPGLRSRRPR